VSRGDRAVRTRMDSSIQDLEQPTLWCIEAYVRRPCGIDLLIQESHQSLP
jgi:hypothetical protein